MGLIDPTKYRSSDIAPDDLPVLPAVRGSLRSITTSEVFLSGSRNLPGTDGKSEEQGVGQYQELMKVGSNSPGIPLNLRRIQGKHLSPHAFLPVQLTRLIFHLVVINFPRSPMGCSLFHFLWSEIGNSSLILPCAFMKTASQSRIGVRIAQTASPNHPLHSLRVRSSIIPACILTMRSQDEFRYPHGSRVHSSGPTSQNRTSPD